MQKYSIQQTEVSDTNIQTQAQYQAGSDSFDGRLTELHPQIHAFGDTFYEVRLYSAL